MIKNNSELDVTEESSKQQLVFTIDILIPIAQLFTEMGSNLRPEFVSRVDS